MQNYKDEVGKEQLYKPRLYTYPDFSKSSTVFDDDDLQNEDALLVLCVRAHPEKDIDEDTVFVWRGHEFDDDGGMLSGKEFIDKVIELYWGGEITAGEAKIVEEEPGEESDDFLNFFD